MTAQPLLVVRPAVSADRGRWEALFRAYGRTGGVEVDAARAARVWAWIVGPDRQTRCLVAGQWEDVVGFVHFRPFERPIDGSVGAWVDDLYVDPCARGAGLAGALIDAVRGVADVEGWSVVRWTTRATNYTARRLYDRIADRAPVVVYNARASSDPES
jgi:GNAT superfamily N-acetyltransferase